MVKIFFLQWCGLWQMWYYIVSVRLVQTLSFLTVVIHNSMKITLSVSVIVLLCAPFNKSLITPTLCIPCSFPFIVITHQRFGTLEISKLLMTYKFVSSIQNFISIFIYNFTWLYTFRWFILLWEFWWWMCGDLNLVSIKVMIFYIMLSVSMQVPQACPFRMWCIQSVAYMH